MEEEIKSEMEEGIKKVKEGRQKINGRESGKRKKVEFMYHFLFSFTTRFFFLFVYTSQNGFLVILR